jgi:very-short-patch-repair endonuclease
MKSSTILKSVYKDCIDRGYVAVGDQLYPPGHPVLSLQIKKPAKKRAKNIAKTGWIDDDRNIRNKEAQKDMFIKLVENELNIEIWPEFYFSVDRLFRLDYAYPELKIGIEVDGGTWSKKRSGHSSGTGLARDREKSTLLATLGWLLIRVTPQELMTLKTIETIKKIIENGKRD